ncbi:type II toxin-antitoxin system VapC family toxin [Neorhizobium alkalisoli]|uniref:PIN domain-containing protein n=1 Tax=Neorhizobium alkalisoli TaxID=528178 RepID=A0A561QS46_9HYPH|nr:type II toxin-antitoxin system VapC family toxin [Neorhizobium alkalisoli]TWF53122.1 hypothetical protein FHW37_104393 [Neorhizobium alkalisoli]
MIVLDTNVISELTHPKLHQDVSRWYHANVGADIYLCDIVVMEQAYGAERFLLKHGSIKHENKLVDTLKAFDGRVLPLTPENAILAGKIRARRESTGRPISVQDAMIAAICLANGATLATRNVKDFEGLDLRLVNPFEGA